MLNNILKKQQKYTYIQTNKTYGSYKNDFGL